MIKKILAIIILLPVFMVMAPIVIIILPFAGAVFALDWAIEVLGNDFL